MAGRVGLAAIVGAYVAGLVLEETHLKPFGDSRPLAELLAPLTAFLGPVFFTVMGLRTNLRALGSPGALALGALLVVAALAGKMACALGVRRGVDRLAVAFALLARGEVTLVFAGLGVSLGVLDDAAFAALMLVVLATVVVTPAALSSRLRD
jgi:Kef-type K+ transport system membrane component KefB